MEDAVATVVGLLFILRGQQNILNMGLNIGIWNASSPEQIKKCSRPSADLSGSRPAA